MRTVRIKVYKFDELTPAAKRKALNYFVDINTSDDWWTSIYEDADNIGLNLITFDVDTNDIRGNLTIGFRYTVKTIHDEHGEKLETYKIASKYKKLDANVAEYSEEQELITERFLKELLAEYLRMLSEDLEYRTSDESIIETIKANDYEFTIDGKFFTGK
jgi:hypothetical protein